MLPIFQYPDTLFPWHPTPDLWGTRTPNPTLRPPKGLTLTVTAGSGRSSRAGPGSLHTGHCLWSRSSSEDIFPLGVSRLPRPPPQPAAAAAAAKRLPLPCPLTPAEAPAPLCPPSSAQALATTSPMPGNPPFRQLAHSALASLSSFCSLFQSVFLPVSLWSPIFCLFLFPCPSSCLSLSFCSSDSVS